MAANEIMSPVDVSVIKNLAEIINNQTTKEAAELPKAERLKNIDNTYTEEKINQARRTMLEIDEDRGVNASGIGVKNKSANSDKDSSTEKSTYSSDNKSYSGNTGYGYYNRGNQYSSSSKTKEEILQEKAEKFASEKYKKAVKSCSNRDYTDKWNMIDQINAGTQRRKKSKKELELDDKKTNRKLLIYRSLAIIGRSILEELYISKKKGRKKWD